jgi:hypothetical protein
MRRAVIWALPLLLLVPAARAQKDVKEVSKPDKKETPAEEYRGLRKEYETKRAEVLKAYNAAKTEEEKQKAFDKWPNAEDYAGRVMKLVQKSPKDDFVTEALVWVVEQARSGPNVDKAMDMLVKDHIESTKLAGVCDVLSYSTSPSAQKYLETIMEKSPHHEVQGQACYSLADYLKTRAGRTSEAKDADKITKSSEKLFERVIEKYDNIKYGDSTLGETAKGDLFEIRNLAIGKVAPQIEGEDINGKKLRLSDYRGKVVVLDFWGNW